MAISITLPDFVATEAEARGLTPERYVEGLVAADRKVSVLSVPAMTAEQRLANLEKFLEQVSVFSEKTPRLPDEAYTRASSYSDHD